MRAIDRIAAAREWLYRRYLITDGEVVAFALIALALGVLVSL